MANTKKEIDKELMYKKLMPSGPKMAKTTPQEYESETPSNIQNLRAEMEEPLPQHHPVMRREVGVPFMDTQPTIVVNAMETVVLEKLDSVLSKFKCCKCDRCKKDIVALALNKLSPKYMVLLDGQPTPDMDPQTNAEVVTAMIQAVLAVRAHPRH
jgi:competence protein ComFB